MKTIDDHTDAGKGRLQFPDLSAMPDRCADWDNRSLAYAFVPTSTTTTPTTVELVPGLGPPAGTLWDTTTSPHPPSPEYRTSELRNTKLQSLITQGFCTSVFQGDPAPLLYSSPSPESPTFCIPAESLPGQIGRAVVDEMAQIGQRAWQLSLALTRALKHAGVPPERALVHAAAEAACEQAAGTALCRDGAEIGHPAEITMDVLRLWDQALEPHLVRRMHEQAQFARGTFLGKAADEPNVFYEFIDTLWHTQAAVRATLGDPTAPVRVSQLTLVPLLGIEQPAVSKYFAYGVHLGILELVDAHYVPGQLAKAYRVRAVDGVYVPPPAWEGA